MTKSKLLACFACTLLSQGALRAQTVREFLTSRDTTDRLTEKQPFALTPKAGVKDIEPYGTVFFDDSRQFQTIEGFGGAFTEAGAVTLQKMSAANQKAIIDAYFDDKAGIGYSVCRTHINSCDFSLGNYSYDDTPGDTELKNFNIAHDEKALLPMIKAAMATSKTPIKIFASPWSPPAWMKTNGQMNNGGKLKPEDAQAWADYFVRYVQEYHKQGVDIWGLTVQNEPAAAQSWDSCEYSAQEETDFVRDHLGPTLAKAGMGNIHLMVWDHNRDIMVERAAVPLSDPGANKYIWGTAIHWYSSESFNNMTTVHDAWPDKAILFTEGCQEGKPKDGDWKPGERYGHNILNDLNHWAVGWTDWNMVLDQTGGPNHANNLCSAPILADTVNDKVLIQSSYYYMGHFSKFIKPGAKRILCWLLQDKIEAAAFENPDKSEIVVVLNRDDKEQHFLLSTLKASAPQIIPPHSIATFVITQ